MGADEAGTLRQLKAHRRALIDPKIAQYRGRIVKTTGDGMLVEFASVVEAVRCAVAVQRGMAERNVSVPNDKRIEFRVGINVGDIVIEGGDIFGDGVNVAARLEALAEAGGICISGRVQEDILGRLPLSFEDRGEQYFKNIVRPIRVYVVGRKNIAELPFPLDGEEDGTTGYVQGPRRRLGLAGSRGIGWSLALLLLIAVAGLGTWQVTRQSSKATASVSERAAAVAKAAEQTHIDAPNELAASVLLPGEPPFGSLRKGTRITVLSSACRPGQVLEIIAGSDLEQIPRRKRCIPAN